MALEDLMGSRIDALKLVSSLTLFRAAAERLTNGDPAFSIASRQPSISSSSTPPTAVHRAPAPSSCLTASQADERGL